MPNDSISRFSASASIQTHSWAALGLSVLLLVRSVAAQSVEITGVPDYKSAGTLSGVVSGVNPATHKVAAYLLVEGNGWWTKSTGTTIDPDGTFSVSIGTDGLDEYASIYSVAVVPVGTSIPTGSSSSHILPASTVAADWLQRYGRNLQFAGRQWGVKESPAPVGPGSNRFSAEAEDVWVDEDGLHLTIHRHGSDWYSSEVILAENLGYGTYVFQTSTEVEDLNVNATFGAFTWDNFGDDPRIPAWPWREIDFEDSRWGDPAEPTTSQTVVQPYDVVGNLDRYTIPDLSADPALTRAFAWSPGQIQWTTALGHHSAADLLAGQVSAGDIIDQRTYAEDGSLHIVPVPSRENFRFNLWLNQPAPTGDQPVEVVIADFVFVPWLIGDYDGNGTVGMSDHDVWKATFGQNVVRYSGADGSGNGVVDAADYTIWRDNFGETIGGGDGGALIVPEPTTLCLGLAVITSLVLYRAAH